MNDPVGILGCGWLGTPLAQELIRAGKSVRGSSTREEKIKALEREGINAFHIRLGSDGFKGPIGDFLQGLHCLIFNIPPGLRRNPESDYVQKIKYLDEALEASDCRRLIYVSSTSVYGNKQGAVDESVPPEPDSETGRQLLEAEELLLNRSDRDTLVVRFGGLIGGDRHPVKYLSGRKDLSGGGDPVNLIHLEDCIRILCAAQSQPQWTGVINAVHPSHPTKAEYYTGVARDLGLPVPEYRPEPPSQHSKVVNSLHELMQPDRMVRSISDSWR